MKTSSIVYKGDIRTEATHNKSGQIIFTDAPTDNFGKGEAFSPTDLVATALGCCVLSIMGIAAKTHDIKMEGTKVDIQKTMADNPRRIVKIEVDIYMPNFEYDSREKSILTNAAKGCPVSRSLNHEIEEVITFHWAL